MEGRLLGRKKELARTVKRYSKEQRKESSMFFPDALIYLKFFSSGMLGNSGTKTSSFIKNHFITVSYEL